jgi:hypothetical protein
MPGRLIDGVWHGSVTEIIPPSLKPDLSMVPKAVLEHARARGKALHRAVELHGLGDLLESSLHPEIKPGFEAYLDFERQTGFRFEEGEFEVRSVRWRYIGHPDLRGWFGPIRGIVDVKYVASFTRAYREYTALQTIGGYAPAWDEMHPTEPIGQCYALWIRMDGAHRVIRLEKPNAKMIFQACVVIHHEALATNGEPDGNADRDESEHAA